MVKWMLECVNDPFVKDFVLEPNSAHEVRQAYDYKQDVEEYGSEIPT